MEKVKILCVLTLLSVLFISCESNRDRSELDMREQKIDLKKIKAGLEKDQKTERKDPLIKREFDPYLSGKWIGNAVSYGPYRQGQAPGKKGPSKEQILEDLKIVSNYWNLIRVYNADADTKNILEVIRENNLPIKMMLGIWLAKEVDHPEQKNENIENIINGIELANQFPDIVIAVSVGNESQVFWSWHRLNIDKLVRYIRTVRNNVLVPVTTADDYNFWNKPESKKIAAEIDFIVTHIYPLWNGKTLDTAIPWMDSTFKDIQKRYPEMDIVLGETGWATTYNPEKKGPGEQGTLIKGKVGLKAQEKYLIEHNNWVNSNKVTTFLFEAFDEPWKGGGENSGPNEIEKHWGVFYEDRTPKESFQNYIEYIKNK